MYGPTVRIGNWFEDVALEKEKTAEFLHKRENGKLLVQQTRQLFKNLLGETCLSDNKDNFVKFESRVQLKAPDVPRRDRNDGGVVIAGTVHDKHIEKGITSLVDDCQLIGSPLLVPCIRSTFVIKPADDSDRRGQNLLFGEEFALQLWGSGLYIRAEKPLVDGARAALEHDPVRLSHKKDRYSIWKILHWDSGMRLETEGAPFPPLTRVVVRNATTGLNLAAEASVWCVSIFGDECGISAHTYVDGAKRETAECLWMFVTRD